MIYQGRIAFTVILDLKIQAPSATTAHEAILDYKNLLLSSKWLADRAPLKIKEVKENIFFSTEQIKLETENSILGKLK